LIAALILSVNLAILATTWGDAGREPSRSGWRGSLHRLRVASSPMRGIP